MASPASFTVCVLCYGEYSQLARRCLDSLRPLWRAGRIRLRLGANMVGRETASYLDQVVQECQPNHCVNSEVNLYKYPVMWRLLHEVPISTPYVMWFDDDSWITANPQTWLTSIEEQMQRADMLGSLYTQRLQGFQFKWIMSRAWYRGFIDPKLTIRPDSVVTFAQGGWWAIRTDILRQWMWPDVEIIHRGGDVMMGELCRQQGYRLVKLQQPKGVAINADDRGRESKSKRRGHDEKPIGFHFHS